MSKIWGNEPVTDEEFEQHNPMMYNFYRCMLIKKFKDNLEVDIGKLKL